eukprot:CAMPEP_0172159558 /NCGR_PEP_ID=MMETSP1050-20130122/5040_1 /TAXON_ID=233186 /ORGANISM="Cryptomonas curvata, Strain CCAP979/52" /LENGTH=38 /DNA_ID= /DNA_START= /DNA_END= /DNA_ORIENTATION=
MTLSTMTPIGFIGNFFLFAMLARILRKRPRNALILGFL